MQYPVFFAQKQISNESIKITNVKRTKINIRFSLKIFLTDHL